MARVTKKTATAKVEKVEKVKPVKPTPTEAKAISRTVGVTPRKAR